MRSLAGYLAGDINARRQLLISLAYDGIVAVSDVVKNKIADINPSAKNIVVIRNGVDIGLVDSVVGKRNHKQVCYVGRLVESKNVNQLLEAFAIVRREEPESKLVIVGDGEDRMRLAALSKKLAVEGSVSFRGRVTDAEKFRIMKSSKVLAFPSKVGEGWGNVVTEGVCCGARVVGYDIPVLREQKTFLDSLMLVQSGDVNAFARALLMALKSIETFDIEHDKKVIREELSWDRASGELESFLYEVVGSYVSGIDPRSRLS
jgi:glycosyltransferase involved in cell wall biosynthesis